MKKKNEDNRLDFFQPALKLIFESVEIDSNTNGWKNIKNDLKNYCETTHKKMLSTQLSNHILSFNIESAQATKQRAAIMQTVFLNTLPQNNLNIAYKNFELTDNIIHIECLYAKNKKRVMLKFALGNIEPQKFITQATKILQKIDEEESTSIAVDQVNHHVVLMLESKDIYDTIINSFEKNQKAVIIPNSCAFEFSSK